MSTFWAGAILILFSGLLSVVFKRKIEEFFAVSVIVISLLLYIGGLFGSLSIGFYVVVALAVLSVPALAFLLVKRRQSWKLLATPGLLAFLLLLFIVWNGHRGRLFSRWDEFSHWGLVIKNMFSLDQLGNAEQATTYFKGYPPLSSLFSYFWTKLSGAFHETDAFRSSNMFLLCCLLPVFKSVGWKHPGRIISLFAVVLLFPLLFESEVYTSIYVDLLLGGVFCFALFSYFSSKNSPSTLLMVSLSLLALPLIKASGTGLAAIVFLIIAVDILFFRRKEKTCLKILWLAVPLFSLLAAKFSWDIYLSLTSTSTAWDTSGVSSQGIVGIFTGNLEEYQLDTIENFLNALADLSSYSFGYIVKLPITVWLCLFFILAFFLAAAAKPEGQKSRFAACLIGVGGGLAVYLASLLVLYLFSFSPYEAENLASLQRYASTYIFGMFAFLLSMFIHRFSSSAQREWKWKMNVCYAALCFTLFNVNLSSLYSITLLSGTTVTEARDTRSGAEISAPLLTKLNSETDKVYIISQNDNGFYYWISYYNFTPVLAETEAWSLGEPYYDGDVWTSDLSPEEFADILIESGYTHVYLYHVDEQFVGLYSSLFDAPDKISSGSLYRVRQEGGTVQLVWEASNFS